ncbi:centromere protein K [Corythoichthys intestinalis]|uniref:centromere protein K n=1 Tax=Corythoichthys intestinalis TaxID=161448 RepID=UPI0025A61579|nr:centromere protein K [Corythoichthys intestinalis]
MDEVNQGDQAASELSEAAYVELVNKFEQQFATLEKLQDEIILREPDQFDDTQDQLVHRVLATEAELKHWHTVEPRLLAENSEVLLKAGKEEMLKLCSELEMVLSCYEVKQDKLQEIEELELKWLKEKEGVLNAVTDHAKRLQEQCDKLSEHSVLLDTKEKIRKMKVYQEILMASLGDIIEEHIPPPDSSQNIPNEEMISISDILEMLMNKVLKTPHDPYVTIDSTFWPPYVEMLLRHGMAVRHQENNLKIRLEAFY